MATWLERLTKPSPTNAPPTAQELRRNDLLVAGVVLFALFLAFGIRNQVINASTSVRLGEGLGGDLPRLAYPARWRTQATPGALLHVVNAGSPSTFDSQVLAAARPLRPDETLEDARADRGIKLATTLGGYRELAAERMTVHGDQPALVSSYAYIADPTRDLGASGLPVVVEAQDIMFLQDGQFVVITLAADTGRWEDEAGSFAIVTDSLRLQAADTRRDAGLGAPGTQTETQTGTQSGTEPGTEPGAAPAGEGGVEPGLVATPAAGGFDGTEEGGQPGAPAGATEDATGGNAEGEGGN